MDPIIMQVLFAAAIGLGVATALAWLAGSAASRPRKLSTSSALGDLQISDEQREIYRGRADQAEGIMRLALLFMPVALPLVQAIPMEKTRAELLGWYARAGFPGGFDDDEVMGAAFLTGFGLAALFAIVLWLLFDNVLVFVLPFVLFAAGPSMMKGTYKSEAIKREKAINRTFPYVLDLLVLTMKSGASLQIAMERVTEDYAGHPVGDEFRNIMTDINMGSTTVEAFQNFGNRVPIPMIRLFVDDVLQSQELGQPIADTLERLADAAKKRRIQDAMDYAGKAGVLVLIPSMIVFMAALLLLFAPFIVRYLDGSFGEGQSEGF
ncbi:MAG: type II secretion system F family protein [Planctomycetota bacterium]